MAKVGDYIRVIGENIEGIVYKTNSEYLVGKCKRYKIPEQGYADASHPTRAVRV